MSARPRPVTATCMPRSMIPAVKPRSYSLSSGGSTESLVSVLDHDSCDDIQLSEDEAQQQQPAAQIQSKQEKKKRYRRHTHENVEKGMMRHKACIDQIETKKRTSSTDRSPESEHTEKTESNHDDKDEDGLSSWERWILEKAKEERAKVRAEIRKKKKHETEEKKKEQEKLLKQKKGEEKYQEWLTKTVTQVKAKNNQSAHQQKVKTELEEEKKHQIEEKAKHKYEEWLSQKKNQQKEKLRQQKQEEDQKRKNKEEIEKRSEEAYREWCNKVQNRPQSGQRHTSFGYTSGKLTGYYDTNAVPTPAFYNPIPWHHVECPRPKSEKPKRSKSKAKYRWNPDKYL